MFTHIAVVRDLVDTQYKEYQEVSVAKVWWQCAGHPCEQSLLPVLNVTFAGHSGPHFS